MDYLDFHAHVFPAEIAEKVIRQLETYYGCQWNGSGECGDLRASMREAGVARCVVFSCATKPEQVTHINDYLASLGERFADSFIPFGTLHPKFSAFKSEIARIRRLGLRGLKFHPDFQQFNIDSPEMLRIYEEVGDSLPMLFHIGDPNSDFSSPRRLARVLDLMPGLRIVAAHFGGYEQWEEARRRLVGRDLWLDISSSIGRLSVAEARKMVRSHGIDRMLFASDYPAVRHRRAIADARSLGLSAEENEKLFHLNAEKLLGLPPSV